MRLLLNNESEANDSYTHIRLMMALRLLLQTTILLLWPLSSCAQYVTLDNTFNPDGNGGINALALQPNDKILVGGSFTMINGTPHNKIARLNTDGSLDDSFNPNASADVNTIVVQPDGKIVIGGSFRNIDGTTRNRIARLNPDGTLDDTFNPNALSTVWALVLQPDGKIVVGGAFTQIGGQTRNRIARLNSDGTLDTAFNPNANNTVQTLALQPDGCILMGGSFTSLGGIERTYIARLHADGTLDNAFNPYADNTVYTLAVRADGRILIGGTFAYLGEQHSCLSLLNADGSAGDPFFGSANLVVKSIGLQVNGMAFVSGLFNSLCDTEHAHIGRIYANGSEDSLFNMGVESDTKALALQADGRILLGGQFRYVDEVARTNLARLVNSTAATESAQVTGNSITWLRGGTAAEVWRTTFEIATNCTSAGAPQWTALGAGTRVAGGWNLNVPELSLGVIRARGYTTSGSGNNSGGIIETVFGAPIFTNAPVSCTNLTGTALALQANVIGSPPFTYRWRKDGIFLANGEHVTGTNTPILSIASLLHADAGTYDLVVDNAYGCATSTAATVAVPVPVITTQPTSCTNTVGTTATFTVGIADSVPYTCQWRKAGVDLADGDNIAGATTATLGVSSVTPADAATYDVVVSDAYGSVTSTVATLTVIVMEKVDTGFNPSAGYHVYALAVQTDGKILTGGRFTNVNGQTRNRLARLNADGTLDTAFDPNANNTIIGLGLQADGKILVGGLFTTLADQPCQYMTQLNTDGSRDVAFNPDANYLVRVFVPQMDGQSLVGGVFTSFSGQTRNRIARLQADGTPDLTFAPNANNIVYDIARLSDGSILVVGQFTTMNGNTRNRIARLNADGTLAANFTSAANSNVYAVAIQPDGKILVAGEFTSLGEVARDRIARLNPDGTIDADFSPAVNGRIITLALQTDGKILLGGSFSTVCGQTRNRIARLNADGSLDADLDPNADNEVSALTMQSDGKIVVGGAFTTMGEQAHNYIARLLNTAPATQTLSYDGSSVTWLRGGTSPEVWRTTFESSTNGIDWTMLGAGNRIADGWHVQGVALSAGTLRARGYTIGRSGIVESLLTVSATGLDTDEDGIPDSWTQTYFGHPTGRAEDFSRAVDDASGTGQNNLFKYVSGLDPTNPASVFQLGIERVADHTMRQQITFSPRYVDRTYKLLFQTNLTGASSWMEVTPSVTNDHDNERTITDMNAVEPSRFYRIQITWP